MLLEALAQAAAQARSIVLAIDAQPEAVQTRLYAETGIGRHIRHITDHFLCLRNGLAAREIDYNQRNRDSAVEHDPLAALAHIDELIAWSIGLAAVDITVAVTVRAEILFDRTVEECFDSTYRREILYLVNHTIHHAAYIKLLAAREGLELPAQIGIAPCTASFQRLQAAPLSRAST